MGCGNSLENTNGAAERASEREKFLLLLRQLFEKKEEMSMKGKEDCSTRFLCHEYRKKLMFN